jgi:hypothetical protein
MEKKHEIFKEFPNEYFIETGSYAGDGIQAALDSGFKQVISLEVGFDNWKQCNERFNNYPNVIIAHKDSAIELWNMIQHIDVPITFFLDGHESGEGTPMGLVKIPILYELNQIRKHHIKTHTIIIDDVRRWVGINPERDFNLENIVDTLMRINPKYQITYADGTVPNDVLIAHL